MTESFPPPTVGTLPPSGPVGKVRGTLVVMLLTVITCGFFGLYWYYATSEEMKRHTGQGLGGGLALIIAFFLGFVSPFITSNEVGQMYERAGRKAPVTAMTGLWVIPGFLILVGPIVWFVKTNNALNAYWRSQGAVG